MAQDRTTRPTEAPSAAKKKGGRPKRARADAGLAAAIEAAGGIGILAAIVGVTTGAVSVWKRVPKKAVDAISKRLKIPPHTLRPDLYGPDEQPIAKT